MPPELFLALDALAGNTREDAALAASFAATGVIISLVGMALVGPSLRAAGFPPADGMASSMSASIVLSRALAPVSRTASGIPRWSVTRCRFVPGLHRRRENLFDNRPQAFGDQNRGHSPL
jgi:hypothetical protein